MTSQKKDGKRATLGKRRSGLLRVLLTSLFYTLMLGVGLTLLAAFILSRAQDGTAYIRSVGCGISALLAFFGGWITGKRCGHSGALPGLFFGLLYLVILLCLSAVLNTSGASVSRAIGYAVILLLACLGGAAGTARTKGHRAHRRMHRAQR